MSSNNDTQFSLVAFSDAQRRELDAMIAKVFRNQDQASTSSSDTSLVETSNQQDRDSQNWKSDEIEFFDLEYENSNNSFIVNVDRHVFYKDVYAFIDRLKNLALLREKNKLRVIISQCLRDFALI